MTQTFCLCVIVSCYVLFQEMNANIKQNTPSRYITVKEIQATPGRSAAVKQLFDVNSQSDNVTEVESMIVRTGKVSL